MKKPTLVKIDGKTSHADMVLREAMSAKLQDVLVIGVKDDAVCWSGFTLNSKGSLLFLLESFKLDLLSGELDAEGEPN